MILQLHLCSVLGQKLTHFISRPFHVGIIFPISQPKLTDLVLEHSTPGSHGRVLCAFLWYNNCRHSMLSQCLRSCHIWPLPSQEFTVGDWRIGINQGIRIKSRSSCVVSAIKGRCLGHSYGRGDLISETGSPEEP